MANQIGREAVCRVTAVTYKPQSKHVKLTPSPPDFYTTCSTRHTHLTPRIHEYRFTYSAWQGDCKGEVNCDSYRSLWLSFLTCEYVRVIKGSCTLATLCTIAHAHTPSLEQHVVQPRSRARLTVARILFAWWYRLLISAEDVGNKNASTLSWCISYYLWTASSV